MEIELSRNSTAPRIGIVGAAAVGVGLATCAMALNFAGPSQAASDKLPNLTPLPASDIIAVASGSTLTMRFAALNWNNGSGRLEVRSGAEDREAGRQKVYQRIYSDTGTYRDVLAGSFVYHEAHQHIHFDDFALYTLQPVNAPGASQRTSAKTTFCIMDTNHIDAGLAGSPSSPEYTTCDASVQGMSVGWGDEYGSHLDGQSIDVTGLPDGSYNLKIEVDPKNRIVESDESDNVSNQVVKKSGDSITPVTDTGPDGRTDTRPDGRTDTRPDGRTDTRPDGRTDTRPDGRTGPHQHDGNLGRAPPRGSATPRLRHRPAVPRRVAGALPRGRAVLGNDGVRAAARAASRSGVDGAAGADRDPREGPATGSFRRAGGAGGPRRLSPPDVPSHCSLTPPAPASRRTAGCAEAPHRTRSASVVCRLRSQCFPPLYVLLRAFVQR